MRTIYLLLVLTCVTFAQFGRQPSVATVESEPEPYLYDRITYSLGHAWVDYGTGLGHGKELDYNYSYAGRYSLRMYLSPSAPAGDMARLGRYLPTPPSGVLDVECFFAYENIYDQMRNMEFRLVHIQESDSSLYYPKIEYWIDGGVWRFENSTAGFDTLITDYNVERWTYWNYFRMVVDVINHEYLYFQINRQTVDMNHAPMYEQPTKSPYFQLCKFDLGCYPVGNGHAVEMWVDEIKVYDGQREHGRLR